LSYGCSAYKDLISNEFHYDLRGKRSLLSDVDYNIDAGKDYLEGTTKFKPVKVELNVSNAKTDQVHYWINEITNQYADLVIANVKADPNKISFDIGSPSMEDLTAQDIEFRMKEYLEMNVPPFDVKELKVQ
jgi:RNAse (barnase) inhibitor barstar